MVEFLSGAGDVERIARFKLPGLIVLMYRKSVLNFASPEALFTRNSVGEILTRSTMLVRHVNFDVQGHSAQVSSIDLTD